MSGENAEGPAGVVDYRRRAEIIGAACGVTCFVYWLLGMVAATMVLDQDFALLCGLAMSAGLAAIIFVMATEWDQLPRNVATSLAIRLSIRAGVVAVLIGGGVMTVGSTLRLFGVASTTTLALPPGTVISDTLLALLPALLASRMRGDDALTGGQPLVSAKQIRWLEWANLNVDYDPHLGTFNVKHEDEILFTKKLKDVASPKVFIGATEISELPLETTIYFSSLVKAAADVVAASDSVYHQFINEFADTEMYTLADDPPHSLNKGYVDRVADCLKKHKNDTWLGSELLKLAEQNYGPFESSWEAERLRFGWVETINKGRGGIGGIHPNHPMYEKTVDLRLSSPTPEEEDRIVTVTLSSPIAEKLSIGEELPDDFETLIHLNSVD